MFDEHPDGDPHGECAAEISRLTAEVERLRSLLLDMRQRQGSIQACIKSIDEALTQACPHCGGSGIATWNVFKPVEE